jgi:hypothetical protein
LLRRMAALHDLADEQRAWLEQNGQVGTARAS